MNTNIKERLVSFIKTTGLSQKGFEQKVGLSNGYINNISKGIGAEKLQNILKHFPDLNKDWLINGEGEMLISTQKKEADNALLSLIEKKDGIIQEQAMEIGRLQERVRQLEQQKGDYQKKYNTKYAYRDYGMVADNPNLAQK